MRDRLHLIRSAIRVRGEYRVVDTWIRPSAISVVGPVEPVVLYSEPAESDSAKFAVVIDGLNAEFTFLQGATAGAEHKVLLEAIERAEE